jgi:CRISPR-associated protein Cas2
VEGVKMNWLISYDIVDNRRRKRIADYLESIGTRVQYSVFECDIKTGNEKAVAMRLLEIIDQEEDKVALYMQCGRCRQAEISLGNRIVTCERPALIII